MFLRSRLALSRVQHWSLLQCPVINQCVASMRVHYSCLRLPTPPLPPHVHPHHSVTPSGWFCGRFYSFFVVYGVFFLFLFAKLHKYNDTLATSVAQCRCHHPPVLRSVRLGFGKSWIRSLVLLKSTM